MEVEVSIESAVRQLSESLAAMRSEGSEEAALAARASLAALEAALSAVRAEIELEEAAAHSRRVERENAWW